MAVRFTYPEGKFRALTMSYDDGVKQDRRLVEIFNRYGIKGTFHLNSGVLDTGNRISASEVASLYKGHEVAVHTVTHPFLERIPHGERMREVWEDRKRLEELVGYPVTGMSYPMGTCNDDVVETCRMAGIVYSRTTVSTGNFRIPEEFLRWSASCHHSGAMPLVEGFLNSQPWHQLNLFYVWGHAYEFDHNEPNNNWEMIEEFCRKISGDANTWYATNMEIYTYITAMRSVVTSCDGKMLYNPTATTLWFKDGETLLKLEAGQTIRL